jgi:uncharacterized protein
MRHPNLELILGELSSELKALYRERFVGLWLYGSQARGDASPESDIDVLLVLIRLDRPALEIDRYAGILADLNLRHGVLLSVIPVAQSQLLEASGPFWRNARAEGIAAFEKRQQADYLPESSSSKFGFPQPAAC